VTTGVWNMDTNILSTNSRDYLQTVNSNNDIANLSVLRSLSDEVLSTIPSSNWFFTNWLSKYYPLFRVQKNPDINGVDNSTNSYAYVGLDSGDYGAQTIEKFQAMTTIRPLTNSNTLRRPVNSNIQYRP